MKHGKYPDLTNQFYHQDEGISSSALKKLLKSAAHYQAYLNEDKETSKEMTLGSLVHTLILEPDKLEEQYFVGEFNVRRGKDYEAALKLAGDRTVVTQEEFEKAEQIVEAFRAQAIDHPLLNGKEAKLLDGEKEHSYYWEDPKTAILCKCRPDNLTPDGMVIDIKTTRDAGLDSFQKTVTMFGYHLSAAFYLRGIEAVTGVRPKGFTIIAIETEAPYAFQVFQFGEQALRIGTEEFEKALEVYAEAVSTDLWPAYGTKVVELELPNWYNYSKNKK